MDVIQLIVPDSVGRPREGVQGCAGHVVCPGGPLGERNFVARVGEHRVVGCREPELPVSPLPVESAASMDHLADGHTPTGTPRGCIEETLSEGSPEITREVLFGAEYLLVHFFSRRFFIPASSYKCR